MISGPLRLATNHGNQIMKKKWIWLAAVAMASPAYAQDVQVKEPGIEVEADFTQFLGIGVAGDGDKDPRYGGRLDVIIDVPITKSLSINIHPEFIYGKNVNNIGDGTILPTNTAMMFPENGKVGFDLSLYLKLKIGPAASVSVGKFNIMDLVEQTPIVGGGGLEGFQNIAFAAPPDGLVPPSLFGAMLTVPTKKAIFSLWVFDPEDATQKTGFEDPFSKGVSVLGSVAFPVTIGGKPGLQSIKAVYSTKSGIDLTERPQFTFPEGFVFDRKDSRWSLGYAFQQFLWMNPDAPGAGWGVFGQLTVSDGNPTPVDWSGLIGIAGNPVRSRPKDKAGIGYFRQSFSGPLTNAIRPFLDLGDEQGIEAFYTAQVGKVLRFTGNVQVVDPGDESKSTAVIFGLRARTSF